MINNNNTWLSEHVFTNIPNNIIDFIHCERQYDNSGTITITDQIMTVIFQRRTNNVERDMSKVY